MANTLKFGAGQWATKEGSTLAYNDENDNYKPLPFYFTRASSGTVVNKAGLIETVGNGIPRIDFLGNTQGALKLEPQRTNLITYSSDFPNPYWTKSGATIQGDPSTAGSELVTNGDFATDSVWAKDTGWTISGGLLNCNTTISNNTRQLISSYSTSKVYLITYTVSNYVSGGVRIDLGYNNGATRTANGTYTEQMSFVNGGAFNGYLRIFSNGASNLKIDNVSVKEVQGFTSPDGTNNAYKLVEGTNDGAHAFYNSTFLSLNGQSYTFSMFVKYNGRQWFRLWGQYGNSNKSVYFDIQNGLVGTKDSGVTGNIEDYGNGWYRISATATTDGTASRFRGYLAEADNDPFYQGNGTSGVYIYGAQVEQGSYPTSYIPTQGSAVTRLRDECLTPSVPYLIGQTEGTIFWQGEVNYLGGGDGYPFSLSASTTNFSNAILLFRTSAGNLAIYITKGGAQFSSPLYYNDSASISENDKYAIGYAENDLVVYKNGVQIISASSGQIPSTNFLFLNSWSNTFTHTNNTKQVQLYNTRLSNSELIALTQV